VFKGELLNFQGAAPGGESLYRQAQSLWLFWVFLHESPGRIGCDRQATRVRYSFWVFLCVLVWVVQRKKQGVSF